MSDTNVQNMRSRGFHHRDDGNVKNNSNNNSNNISNGNSNTKSIPLSLLFPNANLNNENKTTMEQYSNTSANVSCLRI